MRVLLVDHEDSFVYNLLQSLRTRGAEVLCLRSTEPPGAARGFDPDAVVLSPGPGHPSDRRLTALSRRLLRGDLGRRPTLGVCLGHQLIAETFGARVVRGRRPVHGDSTPVRHDGSALYHGIPSPFPAARYHSLVVDPRSARPPLSVSARAPDGTVMGLRVDGEPVYGVQFHPESYLTPHGDRLLGNFLAEARR